MYLEELLDGTKLDRELGLHHAGGLGANPVNPHKLDGHGHIDLVSDANKGKGNVIGREESLDSFNATRTRAENLELARSGARGASEGNKRPTVRVRNSRRYLTSHKEVLLKALSVLYYQSFPLASLRTSLMAWKAFSSSPEAQMRSAIVWYR